MEEYPSDLTSSGVKLEPNDIEVKPDSYKPSDFPCINRRIYLRQQSGYKYITDEEDNSSDNDNKSSTSKEMNRKYQKRTVKANEELPSVEDGNHEITNPQENNNHVDNGVVATSQKIKEQTDKPSTSKNINKNNVYNFSNNPKKNQKSQKSSLNGHDNNETSSNDNIPSTSKKGIGNESKNRKYDDLEENEEQKPKTEGKNTRQKRAFERDVAKSGPEKKSKKPSSKINKIANVAKSASNKMKPPITKNIIGNDVSNFDTVKIKPSTTKDLNKNNVSNSVSVRIKRLTSKDLTNNNVSNSTTDRIKPSTGKNKISNKVSSSFEKVSNSQKNNSQKNSLKENHDENVKYVNNVNDEIPSTSKRITRNKSEEQKYESLKSEGETHEPSRERKQRQKRINNEYAREPGSEKEPKKSSSEEYFCNFPNWEFNSLNESHTENIDKSEIQKNKRQKRAGKEERKKQPGGKKP